jgi:hypothetical protein
MTRRDRGKALAEKVKNTLLNGAEVVRRRKEDIVPVEVFIDGAEG